MGLQQMETSSARPYFAIFAIIAIAVAAFILKNEFAGAAEPDTKAGPGSPVVNTSPARGLVRPPGAVDQVPEPIPDWFKRVGYQKLGFADQAEMDHAQKLMTTRGLTDLSKDDVALIRKLHSSDNAILKSIGFNLLVKVQGTESRKQFVPEVVAMYSPKGSNQEFMKVALHWVKSGDRDLVEQMAKDSKQPEMVAFLETALSGQDSFNSK